MLGSQKLHICLKVTKMGSIIGHRIAYNGVGALRGERHIPSKNKPTCATIGGETKSGGQVCIQGYTI